MGAIQGAINQMLGTAGAAATVAKKFGAEKPAEDSASPKKNPGIDAKMAAKARRVAQQKINAIYANKELSAKARTRRMGQVMDEYNKIIGGKG